MTVLAAYGLSRPGSLLHRPLLFFVLVTFLIGPGIIPSYLLVSSLGLTDTYAALILPMAINAFNLVVMRTFFMNIPGELIDSARVDGASDFTILRRIVMPLSKAVIAVVGLFYAVGYWNNFFQAMLYVSDAKKWPVQLVLRQYVVQGSPLPTGVGGVPASSEVLGDMAARRPVVHQDGDRGDHGVPGGDHLPVRAATLHQGRDHRRHQRLMIHAMSGTLRVSAAP